MTDQPTPRPADTPTRGVHVIPGQIPEGYVPPSTSMATPGPREWCAASARTFGRAMPHIGPCVLRYGHDGPVHQDENGAQWTDLAPAAVRDPHPYVHLTYGPWEASGHQCGDVQPDGCDEPIDMRRVTAQAGAPGAEQLIGWELRDCQACGHGAVPVDLRQLAVEAINANDELPEGERDMTPDHILRAVVPEIERRAVEAERAAIIAGIKDYFAVADDPVYEDVRILCGRIERGEYRARKEGR